MLPLLWAIKFFGDSVTSVLKAMFIVTVVSLFMIDMGLIEMDMLRSALYSIFVGSLI